MCDDKTKLVSKVKSYVYAVQTINMETDLKTELKLYGLMARANIDSAVK